jgi:hypothetical protein
VAKPPWLPFYEAKKLFAEQPVLHNKITPRNNIKFEFTFIDFDSLH